MVDSSLLPARPQPSDSARAMGSTEPINGDRGAVRQENCMATSAIIAGRDTDDSAPRSSITKLCSASGGSNAEKSEFQCALSIASDGRWPI